jgi:hypothetical protein
MQVINFLGQIDLRNSTIVKQLLKHHVLTMIQTMKMVNNMCLSLLPAIWFLVLGIARGNCVMSNWVLHDTKYYKVIFNIIFCFYM